ncbi:MAG: hypothetical protein WBD31_30000 [Rubripirellula sp.]
MSRIVFALFLCLPLFAIGCSSENSSMIENASDEDVANYERLIAEANGEVEAQDEEGSFDE